MTENYFYKSPSRKQFSTKFGYISYLSKQNGKYWQEKHTSSSRMRGQPKQTTEKAKKQQKEWTFGTNKAKHNSYKEETVDHYPDERLES